MAVKNTVKGKSYTLAWERIAASRKAGFPLEAVAICESIISDRLISYAHGQGLVESKDDDKTFINLNRVQKEIAKAHPSDSETRDLMGDVENWAKARNKTLHSLAQSHPGTATEEPDQFIKHANATADKGADLARAVCRWHDKMFKLESPEAIPN